MAKTKMKQTEEDDDDMDYETNEAPPKDAKALRSEVSAYLSKLGLASGAVASGGASDGFDDRDFRPKPEKKEATEKAAKKTTVDARKCEACSFAACC